MSEETPSQPSGEITAEDVQGDRPVGPAPTWDEKPVPSGPDYHVPCASWSGTHPGPIKVVAARVRGRKHKHLGQHCDDWFEISGVGDWTVIAVADGAGSHPLSRVGARAACMAAVKFMSERLSIPALRALVRGCFDRLFGRGLSERDTVERDRVMATDALLGAVGVARAAVIRAAWLRRDDAEHCRVLGHTPSAADLATTLLLAAYKPVVLAGQALSLIVSCQIGDGVVAAVTGTGPPTITVLGEPDAGEFAGQTEFLTGLTGTDEAELAGRVRSFLGPLRMLVIATDGVADDYFPHDPGLLRLGNDLETMGVIPAPGAGPGQAGTPLTRLGSPTTPDQLLRDWLDSYYVRGSFDDRTLVVLHPGGGRDN